MKIDQARQRFLLRCEAKGRSAATITFYRNQFKYFVDWLGERDWMAEETLFEYFAGLQRRVRAGEIQPETAEAAYRALSALCNWLHKPPQQRIAVNPMLNIERPHVPKKEPRRTSLEELRQLLQSIQPVNWVDRRDRLIILMLFWCALRVSALSRVRVADVDVAAATLRVGRDKGGPHYVPLLPVVKIEFTAYLYVLPPSASDTLFVAADGRDNPLDTGLTADGIRQMLERRSLAAGFARRKNPHSFRHGVAMHLLNELGADIDFISELLGHKDVATTKGFYAFWKTAGLSRKYEKLVNDSDINLL